MSEEIIDHNASMVMTRIVLPELKFSMDEEEKDGMSAVTMDSHLKIKRNSTASRSEDIESLQSGTNSKATGSSNNRSYYRLLSHESLDKFLSAEELPKPRWTYLRMLGIVLFLVGIAEIGVGAKADNMVVNQSYGAWWAGLVAVIGGIFAIISPLHLNLMILASLTISPSLVSAIVGAVTDGFVAQSFSTFETCVRKEGNTFHYYGQTNGTYATSAVSCYNKFSVSSPISSDCVCVSDDFKCSPDLRLFRSEDCSVMLDDYPDLLYASMGLCVALGSLALVGSIISCWNVWHKEEKQKKIRRTKSMERKRSAQSQSTQL